MTPPENARDSAIYISGFDSHFAEQIITPSASQPHEDDPDLLVDEEWGSIEVEEIIPEIYFDDDMPERVNMRATLARAVC